MLLLRRDIPGNGGHVRFADAESAIPCLPRKIQVPLLPNPPRRIGLDDARNLRRRLYRTNTDQHVHVIGRAVNDERGAVHLANNTSEVGKEIGTDFGSDYRPATFSAEDQVDNEIAGGVCQVSFAPSELTPSWASCPTACAVGCILAPLRG